MLEGQGFYNEHLRILFFRILSMEIENKCIFMSSHWLSELRTKVCFFNLIGRHIDETCIQNRCEQREVMSQYLMICQQRSIQRKCRITMEVYQDYQIATPSDQITMSQESILECSTELHEELVESSTLPNFFDMPTIFLILFLYFDHKDRLHLAPLFC